MSDQELYCDNPLIIGDVAYYIAKNDIEDVEILASAGWTQEEFQRALDKLLMGRNYAE